MVVGHHLSQGMIADGIFQMSKGARSAELPAGLSFYCPSLLYHTIRIICFIS